MTHLIVTPHTTPLVWRCQMTSLYDVTRTTWVTSYTTSCRFVTSLSDVRLILTSQEWRHNWRQMLNRKWAWSNQLLRNAWCHVSISSFRRRRRGLNAQDYTVSYWKFSWSEWLSNSGKKISTVHEITLVMEGIRRILFRKILFRGKLVQFQIVEHMLRYHHRIVCFQG